MTQDDINNKALYARYKAARDLAPGSWAGEAPDTPVDGPRHALYVAGWLDGRLPPHEAEAAEAALVRDADLMQAALAGVAGDTADDRTVSTRLLERLYALVPATADDQHTARIIQFRAPSRRLVVEGWLARAAIAASLLIVSAAGLGVGVTAGQSLSTTTAPAHQEGALELLNSGSVMSDDLG